MDSSITSRLCLEIDNLELTELLLAFLFDFPSMNDSIAESKRDGLYCDFRKVVFSKE